MQSTNVYDLVLIINSNPSAQIKTLVSRYPHCYLVNMEGKGAKIKDHQITVSSFSHLPELTNKLIQDLNAKRKKAKTKKNPSIKSYYSPRGKHNSHLYDPSFNLHGCCQARLPKCSCQWQPDVVVPRCHICNND